MRLMCRWMLPVTLLSLSLMACGYALVGRGSNIPEDVQLVYLETFENRTQRAELEQFVTQAIAEELVTRQQFSIAADLSGADAVLRGAIVGFVVAPIAFDNQGRADEYEISIIARVVFERTAPPGETGEQLWSNERYVFKEIYEIEASEVGFFDRENLAIDETAARFAETMVSDLLEGF